MIARSILICAFLIFSTLSLRAQITDTTVAGKDTTTAADTLLNRETGLISADTVVAAKTTGPFKDSARLAIEAMPKKALLRSAMLPGLGQYYNGGVWWLKVPAIYGGLIAFGIAIHDNQSMYNLFLKEAQYRQINNKPLDPRYEAYTDDGIITIKNGYRRNRDLSILGIVGVYAVNIIEAYVDAKFFRFDIDDDLSLNISPSLRQHSNYFASSNVFPGIKLSLSL